MNGKHIKLISICDLLEIIYPKYWESGRFKNISWEESSEAVRDWCDKNNAHYYAREKNCFSEFEAMREADDLNKPIVIVEDLS